MRNFLCKLAPVPIMAVGGIIYLLLFSFSLSLTIQQPWLGLNIAKFDNNTAAIVKVNRHGPSSTVVSVGDMVQGLSCDSSTVHFNKYSFIEDPEETPDYRSYQSFFAHQKALFDCLNSESLEFILPNGLSSALTPEPTRPITTLPFGFWLTHALGISTLIFSLGVWAHRRDEISSSLLVLWSTTITFLVMSMTVYGFRELAIDSNLFQIAHQINRFSVAIMSFTIFTLICYYPIRLSRFPYAFVFLSLGMLVGLNELFQLIEWPWHTFYFVQTIVYLSSFVSLTLQWHRSRRSAINRAAVTWFILSIVITNGGALILYALPTVFGFEPLTSLWIGQGFILLMFFGFALGVVRYRLFAIEHWWLMTWVWFFGAALVIVLDGLLVILLNIQPTGALSIAIFIVIWTYLPARQWLWYKLFKRKSHRLENYLPSIIDAHFNSNSAEDFNLQWPAVLKEIFQCSDAIVHSDNVFAATISNHGCDLNVPMIAGGGRVILSGKERGNQLFNVRDENLANRLFKLVKQVMNLRIEKEQILDQERSRIMRDLHDDVGAQLLALVHLSETNKTQDIARQTLKSLRELVYALRSNKNTRLTESFAKWREELMQRANSFGIQAEWHQPELGNMLISARQSINLGSIFREATTNALKHSDTDMVTVSIIAGTEKLIMIIANNNTKEINPDGWSVSAGRANMITRIQELDGTIEWKNNTVNRNRIEVIIEMPIRSKVQ